MPTIGPMIADSAKLCVGYAQRMLTDVEEKDFAKFARVGDQVIESNHPAFIYGHLSLYPSRVVSELGGDATSVQPSANFGDLFSPQATCQDDPQRSIYPPMDEITERFFTSYQMAIDTLERCDDELFAVPNANEKMRGKFATKGSMHAFYCGGHMMIHLGQMSAWRRAMGLGPA